MPVIIGTAGHIDHGKTSLVRALTGQDTDRLKEEKERGISIDLGFAYLDAPGGERAGIVDVPGHERFIRNMLAGAHGMDLVLFTVAADDGVMPQSEEHLDILHLLGVQRGIFVITKTDLVDGPRIDIVREEIAILALDTTLEHAPVVPVSTVTGAGLDALRDAIATELARPAGPPPGGYFRLPVDRAFVIHGHGVIVTGTAVAGTVHEGDTVTVVPGGESARVRSLEVHGVRTPRAGHAQRVAMNLAGIERTEVRRGHVVCDQRLARPTQRFDARVEIRPAAKRPLASHARVRLHLGTAEVMAKVVVLGGDRIPPRASGWAQVVTVEPVLALRGDRFILRDETARRTLGGGVVVHPFADRHRTGEADLADRLEALRAGDARAAARALLELSADFASEQATVAQTLNVTEEEAAAALAATPDVLAIPDARAPEAWTTPAKWTRFEDAVCSAVAAAHQAQPLAPGVEMESLRSGLPFQVDAKTFRWCIERLVAAKRLVRDDSVVRAPAHKVALGAEAQGLAARVEQLLAEARFTPPDLRQLEEATGAPRRRLVELLSVLESERRVVRVSPDLYWAPDAVAEARSRIESHCRTHGDITAAAFRDLIGASRKFAIAFLDWCDRTGITVRVGDLRRLRH